MKRLIIAHTVFDGMTKICGRTAIRIDEVGRICDVGPAGTFPDAMEGADVMDCPPDTTLMPGLIDLNMKLVRFGRLPSIGWRDEPLVETILRCRKNLGQLVAEGCTHIRDLAAPAQINLQLRDAIAGGRLMGPHITAAGCPIAAIGRPARSYPVMESRSADDSRGHARALLAEGVDVISIAVTSGAATYGWQQMTEAEVAAVVQEAHRAGKRVAAVCVGAQGAAAAVSAGVDSVEHGVDIDDRTLAAMAQTGIHLVPTLRILGRFASSPDRYGVPPAARAHMAEMYDTAMKTLARAAAAGVTIATGTDRHVDESVADEVEELTLAGLPSMEALRAATSSASRVLGLENEIGSIRGGARANLLLVRGDPTKSPSALKEPVWVMMNGELIFTSARG